MQGNLREKKRQCRWTQAIRCLTRVTIITKSRQGDLPLDLESNVFLSRGSIGCPPKANTKINIYLDTKLDMAARYAYYFSGTLVPPAVTDTHAYLGMRASVTLYGCFSNGLGQLTYNSDPQRLIPTLTYPDELHWVQL